MATHFDAGSSSATPPTPPARTTPKRTSRPMPSEPSRQHGPWERHADERWTRHMYGGAYLLTVQRAQTRERQNAEPWWRYVIQWLVPGDSGVVCSIASTGFYYAPLNARIGATQRCHGIHDENHAGG